MASPFIRHAATLASHDRFFEILRSTPHTQIALMCLEDGKTSGEYGTDHPPADQTVYVLEGAGKLRAHGRIYELTVGDLVLIPAGMKHQVIGPNKTLNIYSPVAYPDV